MKEATHEQVPVNERVPGRGTPQSRRTAIFLVVLLSVAGGMFGFAYVNAEYFVMLCQNIGILSDDPTKARSTIADGEGGREVEVYFSAHVNDNLPIAFSVDESFQTLNLGKANINDYHFTNLSDDVIYFRPVHDLQPDESGEEGTLVLEKCFCFSEQKIEPGEKYSLPVKYTFTDNLPDNVHVIKMSYTLFKSSKEAYERSIEAAEAGDPDMNTAPGSGGE